MRLYYKGKYSGNPDELPYLEHEPGAVQFREAKDAKQMGKITTTLSIALLLPAIILCWIRAGDVFFGYGIILLYLLTIIPHELLHAMCFQGDVYLYHDLRHGMVFIVGPERMSKCRFIIKSLLPGFVLGVIHYISFLINPELRILGLLGALGIATSAGDYYNVYNALRQMPKGARAYMHKYNTFWYIPDSKRFD